MADKTIDPISALNTLFEDGGNAYHRHGFGQLAEYYAKKASDVEAARQALLAVIDGVKPKNYNRCEVHGDGCDEHCDMIADTYDEAVKDTYNAIHALFGEATK